MAWVGYVLATAVLVLGMVAAAHRFPVPFDWTNAVISALASRKHNPGGAAWFAGALVLAMVLLWPLVRTVAPLPNQRSGRLTVVGVALRVGLLAGALVGMERLVFFHFSLVVRKGHELLALVAFLTLYGGVLGAYARQIRAGLVSRWLVLPVVVPLVASGVGELVLYLLQRDTGWADHDWRGTGTPWWLRFAVWQWLAAAMLWTALGHLLYMSGRGPLRVNGGPAP